VIVDRTAWGRLRLTGGDRVRFLQGLTTVNVESSAMASTRGARS
jgi:folate-binding Fe-S cluster repair protein YgfZ